MSAATVSALPLFAGLAPAQLEHVRAALVPARLTAGARVFAEGEPGDHLLVIAEGCVRSSNRGPDGRERTLSDSAAGDVVGEIALLTRRRRTATVTAVTDVHGWTLDRRALDALRWDPSPAAVTLVRRLAALVAARLRARTEAVAAALGAPSAPPVAVLGAPSRPQAIPPLDHLASPLAFAGFPSRDDVEAAVRDVPVHAVGRGELLIGHGTHPPALLLVARGAVEVTVRRGVAAHRIRLAGPGRFVGHHGVLDDRSSPVLARARERSVVLAFGRERVAALLADPARPARAFASAVLDDTARAVREASRPLVVTRARQEPLLRAVSA